MSSSDLPQHSLKHVAIIMDGNGRWAKERKRPRVWGHTRGSFVVSDIVERADDLGIGSLTVYAFSTENWKRPQSEIKVLFSLLKKFILRERERILKNNISFRLMGDISELSTELQKLVRDLEKESSSNTGLKFNVAFGYGARDEIVRGVNKLLSQNKSEVNEQDISEALYLPDSGDVDLLIRTGGDQRISNFLLWQCAYAELYFTQVKWPDFSPEVFESIIQEVSHRDRRFGGLENHQIKLNYERKNTSIETSL